MLRASALLMVCLGAAAPLAAQAPPMKWWLSPDIQTQLNLTADQVKRIDGIFESNLPERRALRQQLDTLDGQLRVLLDGANVDDAAAAALIEQVEAARARRNVTRMMMLYRIRKTLTPDQRTWFDRRLKQYAR